MGAILLLGLVLHIVFFQNPQQEEISPPIQNQKTGLINEIFNLDKLTLTQQITLKNNLIKNNTEIFKFNLAKKDNPIRELSNIIAISYEREINLLPTILNLSETIEKTITENKLQDKIIYPESSIRINSKNEPYPFTIIEFTEQNFNKENFLTLLKYNLDKLNKKLSQKNKIKLYDENSFIYFIHNQVISHLIRFTPRQEKIQSLKTFDTHKSYFTLIIDDMGENFTLAKKFMELPFPVIFSILPQTIYATQTATIAHEKGFPIFLHQPMEPMSKSLSSGQTMLKTSMSANEMEEIIQKNMILVPNIRGINNHTGSKFTTDKNSINNFLIAMKNLAPHILIVDSLTINNSELYNTAKEQGFLSAIRNYFIDDDNNIIETLKKSYAYAKKHGQAYAIGHARTRTLNALKKWKNYQDPNLIFALPTH